MSNKKTVLVILLFSVVAALLTIYRHPELMMGSHGSRDIMYVAPSATAFPAEWGRGSGKLGSDPATISFSAGRTFSNDAMMVEPGMETILPVESKIMPRPYYDDALNVAQRVYMHSAYQGVLVSDLSEYMRQVKEYLQQNGGIILHVSQYTSDGMQYAYLDGKIPADKFTEATSFFSSRARKVMTESINTEDVTGQQKMFSDQLAKLQDQRASRATELAAAKTEADRQRLQTTIDLLDEQIKMQTEAQNEFAQSLQYATINVTASDSERYFNPDSKGSFVDQGRNAWLSVKGVLRIVAVVAIWVAVYAVIWLPIVLAARWLWHKLTPAPTQKK